MMTTSLRPRPVPSRPRRPWRPTPALEPLEARRLLTGELTEGNAALWGAFASDNRPTSVTNDTTHVKLGDSSIHLRTESGFDTGVVFPGARDADWDLRTTNFLAFWSYSDNQTPIGFQGDQPVVVLKTATGDVTLTPRTSLTPKQGWLHVFVPLDGSAQWARATTGSPDLAHVRALEVHQDTWDYGFDIYYDGLEFVRLDTGPGPAPPPGVNPDAVQPRVLLYVFDPILENRGGRRTHEVYGWADPVTLTNQAMADLRASSHGMLDYRVVETVIADLHPYYDNGTQWDDQTFVTNWEGSPRQFPQGHFDYLRFVRENNLAARVDAGEIDEVWIYSSPMGGMWESTMAGRGAYWINGPTQNVPSERVFPIMGLNYERGVGEAIHSFGHRAEGTMDHRYGRQAPNLDNNWNRFTFQDRHAAGQGHGGVGNIHFPVNGTSDYDYNNAAIVMSNADDWANYPNFTGARRALNAREWSPAEQDPQREYLNWWYSHLPRFAGRGPDGFLNNWWRYLGDLDQFKAGTRGRLDGSLGVARAWVKAPASGSTVTGTVPLRADAVSDGALGRVDFYVDGRYVGTDTLAPYTVSWDTTGWAPGPHEIVAKAYELQRQSEFTSEPLTVTIPGPTIRPGTFEFAAGSASVQEGGDVVLVVTRKDGADGAVTVAYTTADGPAKAGTNYFATMGTLEFAAGVTSQSITIRTRRDGVVTGPLSFVARLSAPGGGAGLGPITTSTITVLNRDVPPVTPRDVTARLDSRGRVARVIIRFQGELDATRARRTAAYRLAYPDRSGRYDTPGATVIPLASVSYDARTFTVTLTPRQPVVLDRTVQLRVRAGGTSGLVDRSGRAIDGNRDGQPGGDLVALVRRGGSVRLARWAGPIAPRAIPGVILRA